MYQYPVVRPSSVLPWGNPAHCLSMDLTQETACRHRVGAVVLTLATLVVLAGLVLGPLWTVGTFMSGSDGSTPEGRVGQVLSPNR